MLWKVLAVLALVTLPVTLSLWQRSHTLPSRYRWDVTPHKSLTVYLREGICGLHILTMPTHTAIRSEFSAPLRSNAVPNNARLLLTSSKAGPFRNTWFVFPFWAPAMLLIGLGVVPIVRGPGRRWWRERRGFCTYCAYDLRGCRSGACPECGVRYR